MILLRALGRKSRKIKGLRPSIVENVFHSREEWLRYCIEAGTLEDALKECGFSNDKIEEFKAALPHNIYNANQSAAYNTCAVV